MTRTMRGRSRLSRRRKRDAVELRRFECEGQGMQTVWTVGRTRTALIAAHGALVAACVTWCVASDRYDSVNIGGAHDDAGAVIRMLDVGAWTTVVAWSACILAALFVAFAGRLPTLRERLAWCVLAAGLARAILLAWTALLSPDALY